MLRQPVAGVTGGLGMLRKVEGVGERIGGREAFADIRAPCISFRSTSSKPEDCSSSLLPTCMPA